MISSILVGTAAGWLCMQRNRRLQRTVKMHVRCKFSCRYSSYTCRWQQASCNRQRVLHQAVSETGQNSWSVTLTSRTRPRRLASPAHSLARAASPPPALPPPPPPLAGRHFCPASTYAAAASCSSRCVLFSMAADELRVTYVKDFRDAVHEILDAPPPSSASNLWHLGSVVFVDLKGRDLGRPRAEAPHCSLELITVVVPSLQQAYAFDVSALANRTPGELVCLAVLPAWRTECPLGSSAARHPCLLDLAPLALGGTPRSGGAAVLAQRPGRGCGPGTSHGQSRRS